MEKVGLRADTIVRANKFLQEIRDSNTVYYVRNGQNAIPSDSHHFEDSDGNACPVIPFWSKSFLPYARAWGEGLDIQELPLEAFKEHWLNGMEQDGVIVGLNWDQHGIGYEVEPIKLLEILTSLEKGNKAVFEE